MTDEELFGGMEAEREDRDLEDLAHLLTEEEKRQLEIALKMDNAEADDDHCCGGRSHLGIYNSGPDFCRQSKSNASVLRGLDQNIEQKEEKKGWLDWSRRSFKQDGSKKMAPRSSLSIEGKVSDLLGDDSGRMDSVAKSSKHHSVQRPINRRLSDFKPDDSYLYRKDRDMRKNKKGVWPVLWLTSDFPLKVEELLPLLDILADKVKVVRRLRELLTTKLPTGTFRVKVAILVVPTIRVIVTFSKFEELSPVDVFATPLSSPDLLNDPDVNEHNDAAQNSNSWFSWIKGSGSRSKMSSPEQHCEESVDPFAIPTDSTWTSMSSKKQRMNTKKSKKKNEEISQ